MADAIDDLFRRFGKAFNKADVEEIAACVTDDFEWRLNAGALFGGAHPSRRRQTVRHLQGHRHRSCRQAVRPLRHRPLRTEGRQDRAQGQLPQG